MRPGFIVTLNPNKTIDFQLVSPVESLIKVALNSGIATVILIGKIYYKNSFQASLTEQLKQDLLSDADLILELFKQGGIEALIQLEGEFSYVIIDHKKHRILAYRDSLGTYPLYETCYQQKIIISSNLKLLAKSRNSIINQEFIAAFLAFPFACVELPTEQTAFQNIQRILPGNLLEFSSDQTIKKLWSWDWNKTITPIEKISPQAAGLRFREILEKAIQERIKNYSFAAHLSGGMDSSSIVCLARNLDKNSPLLTLSLVYQMASLVKETDYINLILQQNKGVVPNYIQGDQALDFQWFQDQIPDHDEPYSGLFHFALEKALINVASPLNIQTILSGNGAEMLVEGNHYYLADLMRQGNWDLVCKQARQWAIAKHQNLGSVIWEWAIAPLTPPWLRQGIPTLLRGGYGVWPNLTEFAIAPWIKQEFAKEYGLWPQILAQIDQLSQYPIEGAFNRLGRQAAVGNWANWYLASPQGIQISYPFLDPRLISYSFSLPREIREVPGIAKPLLQEAMKGILPEAIRTRRIKASFNEVYGRGLRQNLTQLIEMVKQSSIDELEIFDKSLLIECMEQQAMGLGNVHSGRQISTSLSLIVWFDQGS
ncbi:asparagine synthase-related protein [Crocosphaera sp. XPORK-15E]|uniref:asparagine synthase-related protein n=1 Tax=Crocosphaera sp. XPORK-15E TaxID=3110247 RepID=UPI002B219111|nr:asparagine synthase-related protein [Crocosphaera sp. XPORK-15E]MEA5535563.1 asparagine synthase-related protein [Crocosphaera sp. XPORK-15E]